MDINRIITGVRIKPISQAELKENSDVITTFKNKEINIIDPSYYSGSTKENNKSNFVRKFNFDFVITSDHDNMNIYENFAHNLVIDYISGKNCSLIVYGQTGTGKSHTMFGNAYNELGLVQIICSKLIEELDRINISFIEIYNEKVFDLFDPSNFKLPKKVREFPNKEAYLEDLKILEIKKASNLQEFIDQGHGRRAMASTALNSTSSRSHAIFTIYLHLNKNPDINSNQNQTNSFDYISKSFKLSLVDLAGSERTEFSKVSAQRLIEANHINKSLSAFGDVIKALCENSLRPIDSRQFIPYRNSILTWILKDYLAGDGKCILLATVSPHENNYNETLNTLRFIERAKHIVVKSKDAKKYSDKDRIIFLEKEIERLNNALKLTTPSLNEESNKSNNDIPNHEYLKEEKLEFTNDKCLSLVNDNNKIDFDDFHNLSVFEEINRLSNENEYVTNELNEIREQMNWVFKEYVLLPIRLQQELDEKRSQYNSEVIKNKNLSDTISKIISAEKNKNLDFSMLEEFFEPYFDMLQNLITSSKENDEGLCDNNTVDIQKFSHLKCLNEYLYRKLTNLYFHLTDNLKR